MARKRKDDDTDDTQEGTPETSIAVNDAWTGMLAVSLVALVVATGFLAWDYIRLASDPPQVYRVTNKPPTAPKADPAPPAAVPPAQPAPAPAPGPAQ